jgi:H+/Cl- antiporter ClcA
MLGDVPAFVIPEYSIVSPAEMINYAVLGLLAGVAGVVFVQVNRKT